MRTLEIVDQEYSQACGMLGHKMRYVEQAKIEVARVEEEIKADTVKLVGLFHEAMSLRNAKPADAPSPINPAREIAAGNFEVVGPA